jgi:hypothetical protein
MKTSTIIGSRFGAIALAIYFAAALAVINLFRLRPEFVLCLLGLSGLPIVSIIACRAGYRAGKSHK